MTTAEPPRCADAPVVVTVVVDVTGVDKRFDYLVPTDWETQIEHGDRVRVSLGRRRVGGWVIGIRRHQGELDGVPLDRLKPVAKISGRGPDRHTIDLAVWAQRRWAARGVRPFLVAASPPRAVREMPSTDIRPVVRHDDPHPLASRRLAHGGGVLRVGPTDDLLAVVLAAAALGPALVIAPGVGQVHRVASLLQQRGLSVAIAPEEWDRAAGGVDVVIGTRVAVWARTIALAAIVVLDEHDEALQEERTPTWHARDLAVERGARAGVPVLLVSPIPTIHALEWAGDRVSDPGVAASRESWPVTDLVDRRRDDPWQTSLLTSPLIAALRDHTRTVVCVHNTTGRARVLACRRCRALQRCEQCDAAVGLDDAQQFVCARCGTVRPAVCQACGGTGFANLRPGVTRLREELEAAANRPAVAVTGSQDEVPADAGVYIGTEAVLHRVDGADVVAFLDLDSELLAPRYRAVEQALALVVRAARLVGGRRDGGRVMIQTFIPRHEALQAVLLADPRRAVAAEAARRRTLRLPPYGALARVSGAGSDVFVESLRARQGLVAGDAGGKAGWLVRADDIDTLTAALTSTERPKGARLRIEVDPPRV